jgi:hypothetical protein
MKRLFQAAVSVSTLYRLKDTTETTYYVRIVMLFHLASISILEFAAAICSDVSLHINTLENAEAGSTS